MILRQIIANKDQTKIGVYFKESQQEFSLADCEITENDLNQEVEFFREFHACDSENESFVKVYKIKNQEIYISI